eukprot:CAMPEP_0197523554 /NCGR_PEP_ID=MMETSP1318-20131121/8460_1 /TAXON_ID=552666 /ORGANISM="Partenskyella glossopodia, Strain RCC365" /LENGTH=56 /DNA_ID=CAMNT_0043076277 /DNA_START=1 /DNA_END=168 /DNA_ORIENTATION=+
MDYKDMPTYTPAEYEQRMAQEEDAMSSGEREFLAKGGKGGAVYGNDEEKDDKDDAE